VDARVQGMDIGKGWSYRKSVLPLLGICQYSLINHDVDLQRTTVSETCSEARYFPQARLLFVGRHLLNLDIMLVSPSCKHARWMIPLDVSTHIGNRRNRCSNSLYKTQLVSPVIQRSFLLNRYSHQNSDSPSPLI
jgi:hypothetical protein